MTTSTTPQFPDVHVHLSGHDGNVFGIIARLRRALTKAGATQEQADRFFQEISNAGPYDEALSVVMRWVNVS